MIKKKAKGEDITEAFLKNSIVRVFNFIKFIDEKHIRFNFQKTIKVCKQRGMRCCKQDY